jgi:hypothetical protein
MPHFHQGGHTNHGTMPKATGRVFSSNFTMPTLSFAAALRGKTEGKTRTQS